MFKNGNKLKIKKEYLNQDEGQNVVWIGRRFLAGPKKGNSIPYPPHGCTRGYDLASNFGNTFIVAEDQNQEEFVLVSYNNNNDIRLFPAEVFELNVLTNDSLIDIKEYEI